MPRLRPRNALEMARQKLAQALFRNFRRLHRLAGYDDPRDVRQPLRLAGMADLRAAHSLSPRAFRNWWHRFIKRRGNPVIVFGGRRPCLRLDSGKAQGARWLQHHQARLFPRGLSAYRTAFILDTCWRENAPITNSRMLRRILRTMRLRSADMAKRRGPVKPQRAHVGAPTRRPAGAVQTPGESEWGFAPRSYKPHDFFARADAKGIRLFDHSELEEMTRLHGLPRGYTCFACAGTTLLALDSSAAVVAFQVGRIGQPFRRIAASWAEYARGL